MYPVSATQVQLAKLCWRKWAFTHIQGRREPPTRSLGIGLRTHEIHADYLDNATVPDPAETWTWPDDVPPKTFYPGRIALSMMPKGVYPAPRTGQVEHEFEFELNGITWRGFIDWIALDATGIKLIDHKTSADPKAWGKTDETLRDDVQCILYARWALHAHANDPNITAYWNYGATDANPKKARVASAHFTAAEVYDRFSRLVEPVGLEITRLRNMNADPLSLPCSPDACFSYHKNCPFVKDCNLTTKERLGNLIMGNPLVDSLLKESGDESTSDAQPQPPTPPAAAGGVNPPEANAAPTPPATPTPGVSSTRPAPPLAATSNPLPPAAPTPPTPDAEPPAPAKRSPGRPRKADAAPAAPTKPGPDPTPPVEHAPAPVEHAPAPGGDFADKLIDKLIDKLADRLFAK